MKTFHFLAFTLLISMLLSDTINAQKKDKKGKKVYQFTNVNEIKTTSVKDQYITGTCWSFATNSFLETELIRKGFEAIDLSEMFIIRHTYPIKALNYIQLHGMGNFSSGGQAHDDLQTIEKFGIVPESVYPGLWDDLTKHNHDELEIVLDSYMKGVLKQTKTKLSSRWIVGLEGILDAYLGEDISEFEYNGVKYTPLSFANDYLKINPDDYVELTSYNHHPYYDAFRLEVPDNWSYDKYYNLPIDELMIVINNALANNFSVNWDGDNSETTFSYKNLVAIIPEKETSEMSKKEKEELFKKVVEERDITQEMRQEAFQNMTTTDDHLMHLVGTANDQNGTQYYLTKNSWGETNELDGYLYMSESYLRLKTIAIMVHKDAIPQEIKEKLKL